MFPLEPCFVPLKAAQAYTWVGHDGDFFCVFSIDCR